jgi:hypothetical protein
VTTPYDPTNPFRNQVQNYGMEKPDAYTPYAAGAKLYGFGARSNPTSGPVDNQGYQERSRRAAIKRQVYLNKLKASQGQQYMSSDYLGGPP